MPTLRSQASVYGAPMVLHTPTPCRAPVPIAAWEESIETNSLDCRGVEHNCSESLHAMRQLEPDAACEALSAVCSNADATLGSDGLSNSSSAVVPSYRPDSLRVDTTVGSRDRTASPCPLPHSCFSPNTASSTSSSSAVFQRDLLHVRVDQHERQYFDSPQADN